MDAGIHLSHFPAMLIFALIISVSFGFLSRRRPILFLFIGIGIGWAMYPFSR
jgi:hypothetical protein